MANNKGLVLTLPARGNFCIRARHKSFMAIQASFCRTGLEWAAQPRRLTDKKYKRNTHHETRFTGY